MSGFRERERVVQGLYRLAPGTTNSVLVDVLESRDVLTDDERAAVMELVARAERLNADVRALRHKLDGDKGQAK